MSPEQNYLPEDLDNVNKVNLTYPQYVWMKSAIPCQAHYCKIQPDNTNANIQVLKNTKNLESLFKPSCSL